MHPILFTDISYCEANLRFCHTDKKNPSGAFSLDETITIEVALKRTVPLISLSLCFSRDGGGYSRELAFLLDRSVADRDYYILKIARGEIGVGIYFGTLKLVLPTKTLYSSGSGTVLSFSTTSHSSLQLSVYKPHDAPKDYYGGIIYHVFVDRFNKGLDGAYNKGEVLVEDWSCGIAEYPEYPGAPMKNNTFYGGTLGGIIKKLDYIKSLGADTIYLSPVFDAASNHKYDTADYMTIDAAFGGERSFKRLISACHKRGIKVILDGVFNHTGADSIYFNRYGNYPSVGAYQSPNSEYSDWYEFDSFPDKYKCWWDIEILPRLNLKSEGARALIIGKGGVIDKYTSLGVDGFRLDVADELSDEFIASIKSIIKNRSEKPILYGEVWEDASNKIAYDTRKSYYNGTELDGVMNYPLRKGLIDYVLNKNTEALAYAVGEVYINAPYEVSNAQMNLLGTHDTRRILTVLGGTSADGLPNSTLKGLRMDKGTREVASKRLMALYAVISMLPGIPTVFYADEAGLEGYGDPFNRMPYPWGKADKRILSHYRRIGELRRSLDVLKLGKFTLHHLDERLFVFERGEGQSGVIVAYNNSDKDIRIAFDSPECELVSSTRKKDFTLPPYSTYIFKSSLDDFRIYFS